MHLMVSDFYKQIFGDKVYKISIDAGCTCPNRDGTKGVGGCIFCNQAGSGDFTVSFSNFKSVVNQNISNQAKNNPQKDFSSSASKKGARFFIAYFQNFTNTYGNLEELKKKWLLALSVENVVGLAVATRPDCIDDDVIKVLSDISEKYFVQLELGFQTSYEPSVKYIRRGFSNQIYFDAVSKIHKLAPKIHVVTHVIFGLPGETKEQMLKTVRDVVLSGADGIKIANLYILKDTDLAVDYEKGEFKALEMDEYFSLLKEALKIIPEKMIIHRLTGDPPKNALIAPLWPVNKKVVLNKIKEFFD